MDSCRAEACQKAIEKIVFALNAEWCCFARRRAGGVPGSLTGWGGGANKKLLYCKYSTGNKDICISHSFVLYTTLTTTVALVVVAILIA